MVEAKNGLSKAFSKLIWTNSDGRGPSAGDRLLLLEEAGATTPPDASPLTFGFHLTSELGRIHLICFLLLVKIVMTTLRWIGGSTIQARHVAKKPHFSPPLDRQQHHFENNSSRFKGLWAQAANKRAERSETKLSWMQKYLERHYLEYKIR